MYVRMCQAYLYIRPTNRGLVKGHGGSEDVGGGICDLRYHRWRPATADVDEVAPLQKNTIIVFHKRFAIWVITADDPQLLMFMEWRPYKDFLNIVFIEDLTLVQFS